MSVKNQYKNYFDHIECVCEEIQLHTGFESTVIGNKIVVDSIIVGKIIYTCSEKTVMGDLYRFIHHFGSKLSKYGLEKKIKEQSRI